MKMVESGKVIGFQEVKEALAKGERVLLLVRHAERGRINNEDPTFGENLPITENGRRMSVDYGQALKGAAEEVQFRASPLRRTIMTAEGIAAGMGLTPEGIPTDDAIGNGSAFFTDRMEVWRQFRGGRFFDRMKVFMESGQVPGFAPIVPAGEAYERYVLSLFTGQLGVFVTHDVFIAAYLYAKGIKRDWSVENWPRFLDTAALFVDGAGRCRSEFLRAGFSDRAVGVDDAGNGMLPQRQHYMV